MGIYCNLGPLGDVRGICVYKAFAKWIRVGGRACLYMHMFNPACEGWCFTACCGGLGAQSIAYVDFFCTSYFAYCSLSCIFVLYIINSINQACPK